MKKVLILLTIAITTLGLSACNNEPSTLEEALDHLDGADSYTIYTRISRAFVGPYETWEHIDGHKSYVIGKNAHAEEIDQEYYLYIDEDNHRYAYTRNMSGQWVRNRIEEEPSEPITDEDDFMSMSADWFEKKNGTYVLNSDYYDQFFQEAQVSMTSLEINVEEGNLYMTYKVLDEGGYTLTINTSITDIDNTTVELPFE